MASYFKCFTKLVGRAREEVSFSLRPRKTPLAPEQGRVDGWISAACLVSAEAPKSADDLQLLPARSPSKPSRSRCSPRCGRSAPWGVAGSPEVRSWHSRSAGSLYSGGAQAWPITELAEAQDGRGRCLVGDAVWEASRGSPNNAAISGGRPPPACLSSVPRTNPMI